MKFDEVRSTLISKDIDIFVCTETWLTEKHDVNVVAIDGYVCFRDDRRDRIGGGVGIWVKDKVPVQRCSIPSLPGIESAMLCLTASKVILFAMYILGCGDFWILMSIVF